MAFSPSQFNNTATADAFGSDHVLSAWEMMVRFALTSQVVWRQFVSVRPTEVTSPGSSLTFRKQNHLTVTAGDLAGLNEIAAPDATASPRPDDVTATLVEYGKVVGTTERLQHTAYLPVDEILVKQIAQHQADVLDTITANVAAAGTNRVTGTAGLADGTARARNVLTDADVISGSLVRHSVKGLRKRDALPTRGSSYAAIISHDASLDLQEDTGANPQWHEPHAYGGDTANIYLGEIGTFGGATFIETNRAVTAEDGAEDAAVHRTIFLGAEALAEVVAVEPHVGISPVTDPLNRHNSVYWYGMLGHALFRNEAVAVLDTGVSSGEA